MIKLSRMKLCNIEVVSQPDVFTILGGINTIIERRFIFNRPTYTITEKSHSILITVGLYEDELNLLAAEYRMIVSNNDTENLYVPPIRVQ